MRRIAILLALAISAAGVPASAQTYTGTYVPPRPRYAMLTVRYTIVAGTKLTLSTPAGTFACAPPTIPAGLPAMTCTLAVPRASTVALTANFLILSPVAATGSGKAMTGKQWQGACAGTISDTCTLAMSQDRLVEIYPYTAP